MSVTYLALKFAEDADIEMRLRVVSTDGESARRRRSLRMQLEGMGRSLKTGTLGIEFSESIFMTPGQTVRALLTDEPTRRNLLESLNHVVKLDWHPMIVCDYDPGLFVTATHFVVVEDAEVTLKGGLC